MSLQLSVSSLTWLCKAQLSPPTKYSPKPQDYNLLSPLLDDRFQEPLRIHNRIESSPVFDSISILVESSFYIQNHFELNQFQLQRALKSILDSVGVHMPWRMSVEGETRWWGHDGTV